MSLASSELTVRIRVRAPLVYLFFFFQAEDGIRDIGVTGVQTCALPISNTSESSAYTPNFTRSGRRGHGYFVQASSVARVRLRPPGSPVARSTKIGRASCRERV